jgi:hypothetical protein
MEFKFHNSSYCSACAQYSECLHRVQLLKQELFKQGYVAPMLKLSLQICYGCHHALFDRYEISISQMTMGLLLLSQVFFSFLYHRQYFYWTWLYIWATRWVSYKKQELLPHRAHLDFVLVVSVLVIVFVFCVVLCFVCLRLVSCLHNVQSLWIVHSWLPPSVFSDVYIMVPVNHTRLLFKIIIIPAYWLHLKKEMIGICNDCSTYNPMFPWITRRNRKIRSGCLLALFIKDNSTVLSD